MASQPPKSMGKLHGVPDLPPHYLPREDLAELKRKLLMEGSNVGITGHSSAVGVQGMGGIGKSVLASALAHDSDVRQVFPDGVYWLIVGQRPDVLALQNQLLRQLTGLKETFISVQEARDALHEALEGKAALLVIDDAWTIDDADAFSVTAQPACLLITTRNSEVLIGLGAEEHRVDVLSPSDALKMLAEWVGQKSPEKLPPEAAEVARECGYLPLALAMIGAMIRLRPTAWKDALGRLQRADLEAVKRNFPGYPYPDLLRAIEISVEGLESTDRECYLDLAVFPEDQTIPEEALRVLWNLDELDTRDCMTRLAARSLATWATGETRLILHDLQRDLIHKRREEKLPELHLRLVAAWDALPKLPDAYAWRWVGHHMVTAGRKDDLRQLLLNFNYLEDKLAATDTNALIADYDYLSEDKDLQLVRSAIRLSAHILAGGPRELAGQLIGRLPPDLTPDIDALRSQASEHKGFPWLRPLGPSLTALDASLVRTLSGHTDQVDAVALSSDGRLAVSSSRDKTLRLWDLHSGQTLRTLEGHTDSVCAVAVTPDGLRAVSGSFDKTLRVWDLGTGQSLRTLEGHAFGVTSVALNSDGGLAVSGSLDNTVRVWDLESGQTLRTLQGHTNWVDAVALSPDGRLVVSGSRDKTLRLWAVKSGRTLRTLQGHTKPVTALALSSDGGLAVSGSSDKTLRVWDLHRGRTLCTLKGHTSEVSAVALSSDGGLAVSGSLDKTLRLWNLESGQSLRMLQGHTAWVRAVALTPDGRLAISGSWDKTLRLWNLESGQSLRTLQGHTSGVTTVALSPDGRLAVSGSWDKTLRLWDLRSGKTLRTLEGHSDSVRAVAVTSDGLRAVSGSWDGTLRLWDLESGRTLRTFKGHTRQVSAVAISPDGGLAVSGSWDKTLRLWNLESGQSLRTLQGHTSGVTTVALSPDGRLAVSGSWDKTLRLWDLESGQSLRTLEGHTGSVDTVVISLDGRLAVSNSSTSKDKTLRLWDLESGRTLRALKGHTRGVNAVVLSPDGRLAVSGSKDRTLRVWDLESGQTLQTLRGHTGWVTSVALSSDGRRALSGSSDNTLRLWDLKDGKNILTFTVDGDVTACIWATDNETMVAGDGFGRLHFLQLVGADETKPGAAKIKIPLLIRQQQSIDKPDQTIMPPPTRDQVFISYSHEDTKWREDLEKHLKPYLRGGSVKGWSDKQIVPGSKWFGEIKSALVQANVAVLLVTPDFLASDFIHEHELGPLLKEAEQGGVKIFWVAVRESAYKQTPLKNYQAVLDPSKPLASMTKARRDQAWVKICEEIEKAVKAQNPR